jgi:hypothetical protein
MDFEKIVKTFTDEPELAFRYCAVFARFEYALKDTSRFLKDDNGNAQANWDVFANSLRGKFSTVTDGEFRKAVAFLKTTPPRKQVVVGAGTDWTESVRGVGESDEQFVIRLIRVVRNNLFHGGKSFTDGEKYVGRNAELMKAGLVVMEECLKLTPDVLATFEKTD